MYLFYGFCLSFGTIVGLNFIGNLIDRETGRKSKQKIMVKSIIAAVIYGACLSFIYWSNAIGFYGPSLAAGSIIVGAIIAFIITMIVSDGEFETISLPSLAVAVLYLLYVAGIFFFAETDMFNSQKKAGLIGKVEIIQDLDEILEPIDPGKICLMSDRMAHIKAMAALSDFKVDGNVIPGSRYEITGATKQFCDGQFWWIMELGFQSYFKWNQDKQVPGYLRVSAQNPHEIAQPVQVNKKGEEIHIKYSLSACFDNQAERYLRNHGYVDQILEDWTFEVDDDWNPYLTVSVMSREIGYSGKVLRSVTTLDMQTGQINNYGLLNLPKWIDRGMPLDLIDQQTIWWGKYANADWWDNLFHNDKSQKPTKGWFLTFGKDGTTKWFSGFTSKNDSDKALSGIILVDSRTGKSKFAKVSGVVESVAIQTAESLWSNYKYTAEEPVPYNIYGTMTYVIPMSFANQFKGVSLVSISNVDTHAKGNTLEEAISNYRVAISKVNNNEMSPVGGPVITKTMEGIINLVGKPIMQGEQQIFLFTLRDVNKIFQASYNFSNPKVPFMSVDDKVVISFQETGEQIITCTTFDIPKIILNSESMNQKLFIESQAVVNQEVKRIDQEIQKDELLKSDRLKKVDPKKLKEFIDSQSK